MATFVDDRSEKIALHVEAKVPLNRQARLFSVLCKLDKDDPTARQSIAHTNIHNLDDNLVFWSTSMSLNYTLDRKDKYVLQIRESFVEEENFPQTNHDYPLIGETTRFTLNTLISSPTYEGLHTLQLPFQQDADDSDPNYLPDAVITVRGDLITEPIEYLCFGVHVKLLPNRKSSILGSLLTSQPKPFVVISTPVADDEGGKRKSTESKDGDKEEKKDLYVRIWRNHPPTSPHSTYVFGTACDGIPLPVLNHGDYSKLIRFEVFDTDLNTPIGYEDLTLSELLRRNSQSSFVSLKLKPSFNTPKTHRLLTKTDAPCGYLNISDIKLERKFSFQQYLLGGCQIAVTIGIDCTRQTRSLHQPLSLSTPSIFHQALEDIIAVLQNYDSDKHYPTYCFGAQLPRADGSWSATEHTFPLHTDKEGLFGVQRVLQAYDSFHKNVRYSFPKLFVPVFHQVLQDAVRVPCSATNQVYQVLLYFTEGLNGDEEGMIDAIIASSELPITVIIVGIESPKANNSSSNRNHFDGFSKYKPIIDQETGRRTFVNKDGNRFVDRENVIFVRYHEMSKEQMARYISDKLSEQVVDHFTRVKIIPNLYHT